MYVHIGYAQQKSVQQAGREKEHLKTGHKNSPVLSVFVFMSCPQVLPFWCNMHQLAPQHILPKLAGPTFLFCI